MKPPGHQENAWRQALAVVVMAVAVAVARIAIGTEAGPFFLAPIVLAGLWLGPWAGLASGIFCAALFGVTAVVDDTDSVPGVVVRLFVWAALGVLVGWIAESRVRLAGQLAERDLELAELRTIQEVLAPRLPPDRADLDLAALYVAAEQGVSGDFYVVVPRDGGIVLAVGDVAGRGLVAAKHAWYVRTLIAAMAEATDDPAELLERVNRALLDDVGFGRPFVTAACMSLDADGGLTWALAGHDSPVRLDGAEPLAAAGEGSGLPLGVADQVGARTSASALGPGDGLLVYTDGLTEARRQSADGEGPELFGEDSLRRVLTGLEGAAPAAVLSEMRREVEVFSGGRLADDVCAVALRRKPATSPDQAQASRK